eukprot:Nitzschia sp. Nitz4//scaffold91_size79674//44415//45608//NITZ4_005371-RA/size79674-processed-gene-0.108-mRNA-1//-1//CDS//3329560112//6751//frame0
MSSASPFLSIALSFQGKSVSLDGITANTTASELLQETYDTLGLSTETLLKILCQGKVLVTTNNDRDDSTPILTPFLAKKKLKLLVMATSTVVLQDLATKRSDPTIRDWADLEEVEARQAQQRAPKSVWGPSLRPDRQYKICRLQPCQSEDVVDPGNASVTSTPHYFQAMELLEKLSTDPGVVAVLQERELVVGTLGEMDPRNDVLEKKMKAGGSSGACLLGYNTNGGMRIDIKLRTDDNTAFRSYPDLVGTLLHELSHNWVSDHNLLFWTNFGQMQAEYLTRHFALQSTIVNGRTTAELAGLDKSVLQDIPNYILSHLVREMAQHGLHPRMIEAPIRQRCQELKEQFMQGRSLGSDKATTSTGNQDNLTPRERALAAAETRRRAAEEAKDPVKKRKS